jgi:hypothetical protein
MPKIVAVAGSFRELSYNKRVLKIAAEGAKRAGAEVTIIDLRDFPLPAFDGDDVDRDGSTRMRFACRTRSPRPTDFWFVRPNTTLRFPADSKTLSTGRRVLTTNTKCTSLLKAKPLC